MSSITVLGLSAVSSALRAPGFIRRCWLALQERRKREKVRAALYGLSSCELQDIGISHGDIEYVASHRDIDPRGIRSAGDL